MTVSYYIPSSLQSLPVPSSIHLLLCRDVITKDQPAGGHDDAVLHDADDHKGHGAQPLQGGGDDHIQREGVQGVQQNQGPMGLWDLRNEKENDIER